MLYGSETWCLTEKLYDLLRLFHRRCVRTMCRINLLHVRKHRITTESLLTRLGLKSIDCYVTRRQLAWAGHVAGMSFDRLQRKMLSSWVVSKRPRDSPKFTYGWGLMKSLKNTKLQNVLGMIWLMINLVVCFVHWISSLLMYLIVYFFCLSSAMIS